MHTDVLQAKPLITAAAHRYRSIAAAHLEPTDLMQAAWLGALEAYMRFAPGLETDFRAYAWPRIFGAVIDELRHLPPRSSDFIDFDDLPASLEADPAVVLERQQLYARLRAAVDCLPAPERAVVTLRLQGGTLESIGKQLGILGARVSQRLSRAVRYLKPWMLH